MGPVRGEIMWQAVLDAVAAVGAGGPLDVLDLGGGTGGDAVRLAALGHRVTVVDPSPDALASLDRRHAESASPDGSVTGVLGDASDVSRVVGPGSQDLVICHGVLEHVDDPVEAVRASLGALRPAGRFSAVVPGRPAAILSRAMAGDFETAHRLTTLRADAWDLRADGPRRFVVQELDTLLRSAGLVPERTAALRVFSDLVPSAIVDLEPAGRDRLHALERAVRDSADFSGISGGLQCIACLDLSSPSTDRGDQHAAV